MLAWLSLPLVVLAMDTIKAFRRNILLQQTMLFLPMSLTPGNSYSTVWPVLKSHTPSSSIIVWSPQNSKFPTLGWLHDCLIFNRSTKHTLLTQVAIPSNEHQMSKEG